MTAIVFLEVANFWKFAVIDNVIEDGDDDEEDEDENEQFQYQDPFEQIGGAGDDDDVLVPAGGPQMAPPVAYREVTGENVRLEMSWVSVNDHFNVQQVAYRFSPSDLADELSVLQQFMVFVAQVFEHCRENFDPSDLIQVHCTAATLDKGPLTMPLTRVDQLDSGANHLFLAMQKVLQSNDGVSVTDGSFMLTLYHVESARFGGYDRVRLAKCFTARMLGYHVQNRSYIEIPDGVKPYCAVGSKKLLSNETSAHTVAICQKIEKFRGSHFSAV